MSQLYARIRTSPFTSSVLYCTVDKMKMKLNRSESRKQDYIRHILYDFINQFSLLLILLSPQN